MIDDSSLPLSILGAALIAAVASKEFRRKVERFMIIVFQLHFKDSFYMYIQLLFILF